jgi:hypothetical protein
MEKGALIYEEIATIITCMADELRPNKDSDYKISEEKE